MDKGIARSLLAHGFAYVRNRRRRDYTAEDTFREFVFDAAEAVLIFDFVDEGTGAFDLQIGDGLHGPQWIRVQVIGFTDRR